MIVTDEEFVKQTTERAIDILERNLAQAKKDLEGCKREADTARDRYSKYRERELVDGVFKTRYGTEELVAIMMSWSKLAYNLGRWVQRCEIAIDCLKKGDVNPAQSLLADAITDLYDEERHLMIYPKLHGQWANIKMMLVKLEHDLRSISKGVNPQRVPY